MSVTSRIILSIQGNENYKSDQVNFLRVVLEICIKIFTIPVDSHNFSLFFFCMEKFRKTFFRSFLGLLLADCVGCWHKARSGKPEKFTMFGGWSHTQAPFLLLQCSSVHKRLIWFQLNLHFSMVFIPPPPLSPVQSEFLSVPNKESRKFYYLSFPTQVELHSAHTTNWNMKRTREKENTNVEIIWDLFIQIFPHVCWSSGMCLLQEELNLSISRS